VPDAPVTSFETRFPTGPYSIFGAYIKKSVNANLCGTALKIPTTLEGQNGALIKQTTKIGVTGCPRVPARGKAKSARNAKASKSSNTHESTPTPAPAVSPQAPSTSRSADLLLTSPAAASGAECPNEVLRVVNDSSNLPDCRAYEQVSPTEKEGGSGGVSQGSGLALSDGSAIAYQGEPFFHPTPKKEPLESKQVEQYTSERAPNGWSTLNGDTLTPETVPPAVLPPAAEGTGAQVLEETRDGSKVFFLDTAELLPGVSNAGEGEPDLYEYTVPSAALPSGALVDLTADANPGAHPGELEHGDARGILGIGGEGAETGSYIYYIAGGKLTPNAPTGQCGTGPFGEGTGTGCKLYLYHDATTTYIATLSPKDESGFAKGFAGKTLFDWSTLLSKRTAEVSPNGRFLVFGSRVPLTGQPGEPFEEQPRVFIPAAEIFRFDADATANGEQPIVCVSCGSTGVTEPQTLLLSPGGAINGSGRKRFVLDDGRVFFNTIAGLLPQDTNGQGDVYEWEPPGVGDCTSSSVRLSQPSGGCVGLISGGTSEESPGAVAVGRSPSAFVDASADGSNVFFTTNQPLVPGDGDRITDLYDAREGGGFPAPAAPACAQEADCPEPFTALTFPGSPASLTASGSEAPPPALDLEPKPASSKPLTRAQKLTRALKTCRKDKTRAKRLSCEHSARSRYRARTATKTINHRRAK
jgi:hypothetical protein